MREENLSQKQEHGTLSFFANAAFDVVALAASLGGIKALCQVLSALPPDFPAAIAIVQHQSPLHPSQLANILNRRTCLRVKEAESGDQLCPGMVYIAPPDKHLIINGDGTVCLTKSERVNFVRPSADKLFESVAISFKERVIAVVLTGRDGDGAKGVQVIKKMGGMVIAQDQASSESFSMPSTAIASGNVDFVLPLNEIANTLISMVMTTLAA